MQALDRRLFEGKIISSRIYPNFFPIKPDESVINFGAGVGPQAVVYKGMYAKMVGIDLHEDRLAQSKILLAEKGVSNYETLAASVEQTGLPDHSFDKALAIDIIEHLPDPKKLLTEAYRVLKPGGQLLMSVPAMHDHYVHFFHAIGKLFGRKTKGLPSGHLDAHNANHSVAEWIKMIHQTPFVITKTRATTLWPPLHLYGVPRFWFTNRVIHAIDNQLCRFPPFKRMGQAYLFILTKHA